MRLDTVMFAGAGSRPDFAKGWFADSAADSGEDRLQLEEQLLVDDATKDLVRLGAVLRLGLSPWSRCEGTVQAGAGG